MQVLKKFYQMGAKASVQNRAVASDTVPPLLFFISARVMIARGSIKIIK
jgi:hypothetical protein